MGELDNWMKKLREYRNNIAKHVLAINPIVGDLDATPISIISPVTGHGVADIGNGVTDIRGGVTDNDDGVDSGVTDGSLPALPVLIFEPEERRKRTKSSANSTKNNGCLGCKCIIS